MVAAALSSSCRPTSHSPVRTSGGRPSSSSPRRRNQRQPRRRPRNQRRTPSVEAAPTASPPCRRHQETLLHLLLYCQRGRRAAHVVRLDQKSKTKKETHHSPRCFPPLVIHFTPRGPRKPPQAQRRPRAASSTAGRPPPRAGRPPPRPRRPTSPSPARTSGGRPSSSSRRPTSPSPARGHRPDRGEGEQEQQ